MTSHVRHRRSRVAGELPAVQLEPGELALNLADGKLYTTNAENEGATPLLGVSIFAETGQYGEGEMVRHERMIWVAKAQVLPGAFTESEWTKIAAQDVVNEIADAILAHEAKADPHSQYATDEDLNGHVLAEDPHAQYATDADLAAHVAAADPHPQYATDADLAAAVPPGSMMMWPGAAAPAGWALCNGAGYDRAGNPKLFAAIGTTYGAGNGSTTASLPDMRGMFPRGLDGGRGVDAGRALGTSQASAFASHGHGVNDPSHNHGVNDPGHAHGVYDPGHTHSAWTDAQGYHDHMNGVNPVGSNFSLYTNWSFVGQCVISGFNGGARTEAAGSHAHNVGVGASLTGIGIYGAGTGVSIQARATGISIQANGGAETRPINLALNFIIKLG